MEIHFQHSSFNRSYIEIMIINKLAIFFILIVQILRKDINLFHVGIGTKMQFI